MYHHIKGTLTHINQVKDRAEVVVETGGVGYLLRISLSAIAALPDQGEPVEFLTHLSVREDALTLYGFATPAERALFEALIGVKNIGPPKALSILSGIPPGRAAAAIRDGDVAAFKQIKGIGDKAAKMIVVELKGKVDALAALADDDRFASAAMPDTGPLADAVQVLVKLGLSESDARRRISALADRTGAPRTNELAVDEIVRECLSA